MRLTGTPLLLATSMCLLSSLICHIVATATHYWLRSSATTSGRGTAAGVPATSSSANIVEETGELPRSRSNSNGMSISNNGDVGEFLNLGLWVACFDDYVHLHEYTRRRYDGCHSLSSDYYITIRDWILPAWLIVCRVTSALSTTFLVLAVVLFIVVMLFVVCQFVVCHEACDKLLLYAAPISCVLAGLFMAMTLTVFADNAFRLQCRDFWVGGSNPNVNRLGYSWGFQMASCVLTFVSAGLVTWLSVLKTRDDI